MPYGNRHEVNFSTTEILTNLIKTEDISNPKSNTYSRNVSDNNNNKDTIERIEYANHSRSKYYIFTIY